LLRVDAAQAQFLHQPVLQGHGNVNWMNCMRDWLACSGALNRAYKRGGTDTRCQLRMSNLRETVQ